MNRWWKAALLVSILTGAGVAGWSYRVPLARAALQAMESVAVVERGLKKPEPDPASYAVLVADLERWREDLAKRHAIAKGAKRADIEREARSVLELALPQMMRCWLGTPWDFNGTAPKPGDGKVACGYFVSTVLQDAGFRVDRYRLAQQPSGNILRTFLPKSACTLTTGVPYDVFADGLATVEPGIYVVGLDTHVAFLVVTGEEFRFIHSSGSRPWCVVDEGREEAGVLRRSNWRMLGNLTADDGVVRRWLKQDKIAVREM